MSLGMGDKPLRLGVSRLQVWPPRNSNLSLRQSNQNNRKRRVLLLLVTRRLVGALPRKSVSRYPSTAPPRTLESTRKPTRLFWREKRFSVVLAEGPLPYGMPPKPVPMPLPVLVERKTLVTSINPRGENRAVPILK